jgi:hypothetical protein
MKANRWSKNPLILNPGTSWRSGQLVPQWLYLGKEPW